VSRQRTIATNIPGVDLISRLELGSEHGAHRISQRTTKDVVGKQDGSGHRDEWPASREHENGQTHLLR
jgi:hypothetical protein